MKIDVINKKGEKIEDFNLDKNIFGQTINTDLLSQYIYVYLSNQRQGTSASKDRSQVSGGGRKPWKQKGTGRARHGSTRSPIWVHGGVAHGPKPKSWNLNMPKKMKRASLLQALSQKCNEQAIKIIDNIKIEKPSTAKITEVFENLKINDQKILFVLDSVDTNIIKSINNLPKVKSVQYNSLNAYDVLNAKYLLFMKDSIAKVQKEYNEAK